MHTTAWIQTGDLAANALGDGHFLSEAVDHQTFLVDGILQWNEVKVITGLVKVQLSVNKGGRRLGRHDDGNEKKILDHTTSLICSGTGSVWLRGRGMCDWKTEGRDCVAFIFSEKSLDLFASAFEAGTQQWSAGPK